MAKVIASVCALLVYGVFDVASVSGEPLGASGALTAVAATGIQVEEAATDGQTEDVTEAEPLWTRADCMASHRINVDICNRLPGARERCFAGAAAILAVCLAAARG